MRGVLLCSMALLASCATPVPVPGPGMGLLSVTVLAKPRAGVPRPGLRENALGSVEYGARSEDRGYPCVDYGALDDIVILLDGPGLAEGGPAPLQAELVADDWRFDQAVLVLAPGSRNGLRLTNRSRRPLTFVCLKGFRECVVNPGASAVMPLPDPGVYEIACDEEDGVKARVVVAGSSYAQRTRSGRTIHFNNLRPGSYELTASAPRLQDVRTVVQVVEGSANQAILEVGVGTLKPVPRHP